MTDGNIQILNGRVRYAFADWIIQLKPRISVTLDYVSGVREHQIVPAARHFWNGIDVELYGKSLVKKRGVRLPRACFRHGTDRQHNWHYHCAVQMPDPAAFLGTEDDFCSVLRRRWELIKEAGLHARIEPVRSQKAWSLYLSGEEKLDGSSWCTETSHIPQFIA